MKGHNVKKELTERLLQRLKTSTDVISKLTERVVTKDNFASPHTSLQETIKANKTVIDEAEKELGT